MTHPDCFLILKIIFIFTAVILLQTGCASKIMLHPEIAERLERENSIDPVDDGNAFIVVKVKNRFSNKITGWLFDKEGNYGSIIVAGGNAMGQGRAYEYNKYLLQTNHRLLLISYQGYGRNEGTADLKSLTSDFRSFYRYLKSTFKNEPVYLVGVSIGTPAGICSASDEIKFKKIILEGTVNPKTVAFTKAGQLWPLFPIGYPLAAAVSLSVPDELDINKCMSKITDVPILFIHHKKDKLVPYGPAKDLYMNYRGPKIFLDPEVSPSSIFHLNVKDNIKLQNKILDFLSDT